MKKIPDGIFKPRLNSGEKKSDITTAVATQITEGERSARETKTARLRLERLAYEQAHPPAVAEKKERSRARRPSNT